MTTMRRHKWTRYVAALLFLAFLANLQYIYNFLEPQKEALVHNSADGGVLADPFDPADGGRGPADIQADNDDSETNMSSNNITGSQALDAIRRAKSTACKQKLIEIAYMLEKTPEHLTPTSLPRNCPMADPGKFGQYVGCYPDHRNDRVLKGGSFTLKKTNSISNCIYNCIRVGQELAGVQYGEECFCGMKKTLKKASRLTNADGKCKTYRCPGNQSEYCGGYKLMAIYETGAGAKAPVNVAQVTADEVVEGPPVKIVFLLQVNGKSSRQVRRLIKLLYRRKHFYYVHVDSRQSYMYREMLAVEKRLPNLKVKRKRFSSIWGGASLLSMMLDSFRDLIDEFRFFPWDYVVNLSEADLPLVSVDSIEKFLRKYRGTNFLRSAGNRTANFVRKQGLDQVFYECDHHMYRIGKRQLPDGIRFDGGSDWFTLHRSFVEYAVHGTDDEEDKRLVVGLTKLYQKTLLPAESFFHTLALNSPFCTTVADTNLKLTNWRRQQGCKCQYKHIVDWCGCSPNVIIMDDFGRLEQPGVLERVEFFARKFDAMIDQNIIARIEAQIHEQEIRMAPMIMEAAMADAATRPPAIESDTAPTGSTSTAATPPPPMDPNEMHGFNSYWESLYESQDQSMDELRSADYPLWLLLHSLRRLALKHVYSIGQEGEQCQRRCGNVDTIQRMHVYQESDVFGGLLVQFNGTCSGPDAPWSIEAYVKRIQHTTKNVNASLYAKALLTLEVGTKFDVKEEIFRNYAGVMTVDGSIALRHHWDKAVLAGVDKKDKQVRVIFLDPSGERRGSYVQYLDNPTGFEYTKLPITKSYELETGIWKLQLRSHDEDEVLIAETEFPFLPGDNGRAEEDADTVDKIVSPFYQVQLACRASTTSTTTTPVDSCEKLFRLTPEEERAAAGYDLDEEKRPKVDMTLCKQTYWSSLSPDPKSEITGFDWKTGLIVPR